MGEQPSHYFALRRSAAPAGAGGSIIQYELPALLRQ
jgi:hypothetical protein